VSLASCTSLEDLVTSRRLIVCVGTGGVGKTTVAAAIGLEAARRGRRTLVITIDPARRLANALGLDTIGNVETEVKVPARRGWEGMARLEAMMLDTRTVFDELIVRVTPDEETRQRILNNRIYREVSRAISTSQEYMAAEKLYHAWNSERHDLIVLDTPPLKNALDFLEAPHRLARFLDERIIRWFMRPSDAQRMFVGRRFLMSTGAVVYRLLGYVFGREFLRELNDFFLSFEAITSGFRQRSTVVGRILRSHDTSFLLVCGPRPATLDTTRHFMEQLEERKLALGGMVINLVDRCRVAPKSDDEVFDAEDIAAFERVGSEWVQFRDALAQDLRTQYEASRISGRGVETLKRMIGGKGFVAMVPRMQEPVNDVAGLLRLNELLFGNEMSSVERDDASK